MLPLSAGCKCGNRPSYLFHWILLLWVLWLKFLHFEGNRFVIWLHKNQGAKADENNFDLLRQLACWPFLLSLFLSPFSRHNVVCPGEKKKEREDNNTSKENGCDWHWADIPHLHRGARGRICTVRILQMQNAKLSRISLSIKLLNSFHHPVFCQYHHQPSQKKERLYIQNG